FTAECAWPMPHTVGYIVQSVYLMFNILNTDIACRQKNRVMNDLSKVEMIKLILKMMKRCMYYLFFIATGLIIGNLIIMTLFPDKVQYGNFQSAFFKYARNYPMNNKSIESQWKYLEKRDGISDESVVDHDTIDVNLNPAAVINDTDELNETDVKRDGKSKKTKKKTDVIKILEWTKCFGHSCFPNEAFKNCGVHQCEAITDRSKLKQAQVVLFHTCKLSDLVEAGDPPKYRSPSQRWIFRCMEAPSLKWFKHQTLKDAFNFTMTTRLDSDFHVYHGIYTRNPDPPKVLPDYAKGKSKLAAWIVSHCRTHSRREVYVKRLQEHVPIDIYGKCGTKKCPNPENQYACLNYVGATYKFYIAFENSDCRDYVTEKVWRNAILKNAVPIVRGVYNNFKAILPPGSYIHTNDFKNPKALAKYLKYLDKNNTAYNEYFSWKLTYMHDRTRNKECELCKTLHETKGQVKTYKNIWNDFYSFKNNCYNYSNIAVKDFDK
ncbi:unnamed protein product, partial [Owenia fusiformis]